MSELEVFDEARQGELAAKITDLEACRQKNSQDPSKGCARCSRVSACEKIKDFVVFHFDIATAHLQACQRQNGLNSCTPCELFFECKTRHDYVAATYEKMNEGRGGEFDF